MPNVTSPINNVAGVYALNIGFVSMEENLAITQKYASLACEMIIEPAPMLSTQSKRPFAESKPKAGNNGNTSEDAVMIATVEDPCAVFNNDVIKKGKSIPMLANGSTLLKCSPKCMAPNIAPNEPPAPMITNMPPAFSAPSDNISEV